MGIQINVGDHSSPRVGWIAIPNNRRSMTKWARTKAKAIAKGIPSADVYFKTLSNGRSLTQMLADSSIWINFDPALPVTDFGISNTTVGELAIGEKAFKIGKWTVLATLIHELAHLNGAGGPPSQEAEEALLHCGLGKKSEKTSKKDDPRTPYDPGIEG